MPAVIRFPVSVDLSVSDLTAGIFGVEGDLSLTDDTLVFSYVTKDLHSKPREAFEHEMPLDDLQDVTLKSGLFGTTLVVRPRSLNLLEGVPGDNAHALVFKIKPADRAHAAALAERLQNRLLHVGASVPFHLPSADFGLTEIKGLLYLEDEFLVFEVETGRGAGSQREHRIVKIELKALVDLRYARGLLKDDLHVEPKKRDLFDALPGTHEETVKLSIPRKSRDDAEQLVYEARRLMRRF